MFDGLYPDAADTALESRARAAPVPVPTPWFKDGWSALGKAVPRAGAEMGRAMTSLVTPEAIGAMDAPTMFSAPGKTSKPQLAEELRAQDAAIRDAIKEMTPDAESTGAASMILHDVTRFVGKAATYGALGGAPGAVVGMGLDEGTNEALKRMDEGVDPATAAKLGVTKGIASGVAVALPVAGKTLLQTGVLALAGGPGSYIAEQSTAKQILQSANYTEEAAKIDPFDPMGLGVAFFGSLLFGAGAHAVRGVKAKGEAAAADARMLAADAPPGERTQVAQAVEHAYTPEQVDAAHVSILQAQREGSALHAREDVAAAGKHVEALDTASRQLAAGERVSVADVAPVDAVRAVEELRPMVSQIEAVVRDLHARTLPPEQATANFQAWFADSKVLDHEGKPLVVYHGTTADIGEMRSKADLHGADWMAGMYFTHDPEYASQYTYRTAKGSADYTGGNVMPVYLSMKNPKIVEDSLGSAAISREEVAQLKAEGFDGIINRAGDEYVVFDPQQAKSAIGNSGKFDPNSPSLTDALPPVKAEAAPAGEPAARDSGAAEGKAKGTPSEELVARQADEFAQADPNMMVLMEGMEHPVPAHELLAEARAMMEQELADAPLLKVAAECALRN